MPPILHPSFFASHDGRDEASQPHHDGQTALDQEIEGLRRLRDSLDGRFDAAVAAIMTCQGRVFATGMGKSGHVARKIAATLASTGTPAHFIHPGEASHGDLGMLTRHDMVLALSNSGETRELSDIIHYARRLGLPLIAITAHPGSSLAQAATHTLIIPQAPEACPAGLAPTTSAIMMMALGDALAVALMRRRGFDAAAFQDVHPGGRLGQALMPVAAIMRQGEAIPLAHAESPMSDALLEMTAKAAGCVGIVDTQGDLIGIITDGDLRRRMTPTLLSLPAAQIMTPHPRAIRAEILVSEATGLMNRESISALFVTHEGHPCGIVTLHDCLRAGFR
jgi:arabinose-5-phosphate isomerase